MTSELTTIILHDGSALMIGSPTIGDVYECRETTVYVDLSCENLGYWSVKFLTGELVFTHLDNAFKRAETCQRFKIVADDINFEAHFDFYLENFDRDDPFSWIISDLKQSHSDRFGDNSSSEFTRCTDSQIVKFSKCETPAARVYSPFHLGCFSRVKKIPEKLTLPHIKRLLANGQYTALKNVRQSNQNNTEDLHPLALLHRLVEDASGWWCSLYTSEGQAIKMNQYHCSDTIARIACHTFESHRIAVDLQAYNSASEIYPEVGINSKTPKDA